MLIFTYCVMMIKFLPSKCIRCRDQVCVNFAIFFFIALVQFWTRVAWWHNFFFLLCIGNTVIKNIKKIQRSSWTEYVGSSHLNRFIFLTLCKNQGLFCYSLIVLRMNIFWCSKWTRPCFQRFFIFYFRLINTVIHPASFNAQKEWQIMKRAMNLH